MAQEHVEDVKPMDFKSDSYQKWLGYRSCTTYDHEKRKGFIKYQTDQLKVDYMFDKKAKMFICDCDLATFLVTELGEVYHWLDIEDDKYEINYYSQKIDLTKTRVVLTAFGGKSTFIMLTEDGKVYYFQTFYQEDASSGWMRQMDLGKKVICLSCGDSFFVVITEDNEVYSWGKNDHGQLGISIRAEDSTSRHFIMEPQQIKFLDKKTEDVLVKVACGYTHTLALTKTGKMYAWGGNVFRELGFDTDNGQDILTPTVVNIKLPTILDITAMKNMSAVISGDNLVHLWGYCFDYQIKEPISCEYTNLFDACNALCARPPTSVKNYNRDEKLKILNDLKKAFNDNTTSDVVIKIEKQNIFVHKIILKLRSSYFKDYFQSLESKKSTEEDDSKPHDSKSHDSKPHDSKPHDSKPHDSKPHDSKPHDSKPHDSKHQEIILNKFPYDIYHDYFKYLYDGVIDGSQEKFSQFLKFAKEYGEMKFEKICRQAMEKK